MVGYHCIPRISLANGVRRRVIAGAQTKFYAPDIDALAVGIVQGDGVCAPAGQATEGMATAG